MASSSFWSLSLSLLWWPGQRSHEVVILVHMKISPATGALTRSCRVHISGNGPCLAFFSTRKKSHSWGKKRQKKRIGGPDMGCFMPLQKIVWQRFSRWRMFWGSLNVWVPNGFGFWKITSSLPLKIVLLQMFHAGLPYGCISNAERVPWRSQHGASVEFPLEINVITDCAWQWGVSRWVWLINGVRTKKFDKLRN